MAINQINITPRQRGPSALEQIAQGLSIVNQTLGTALAIPKYLQDKRAAAQQTDLARAKIAQDFSQVPQESIIPKDATPIMRRDSAGTIPEANTVQFPSLFGEQRFTPRVEEKKDDLSDFDKALMSAYSADYTPIGEPVKDSIKLTVGKRDTYWIPKAVPDKDDKTFARQQTLRKEFLSQSAPFINQSEGYGRVLSGAKDISGAGDVAILYGYIKLLDPTSVVREGEVALADQARAVPDKILGLYNKATEGQLMGPDQRKDFINKSRTLYETAKKFQNLREENYRNVATENDINPNLVVQNLGENIISSIEKSISGVENLSDDELAAQIAKKRGSKR